MDVLEKEEAVLEKAEGCFSGGEEYRRGIGQRGGR